MNKDLKDWEEGVSDFVRRHSENKDAFKEFVDTPSFISLLGKNIKGKKILDIGCGNGDLCMRLVSHGAEVVGLDGSKNMIDAARINFSGCEYVVCDMMTEELPFEDDYFDIVTAKLSMMYFSSLKVVSSKINKSLKENGLFVIDIIHPFLPLLKSRTNVRSRYPKDLNYFEEIYGSVRLKDKFFAYYYRPLSQYLNDITDSGFSLVKVQEPYVNDEFTKKHPEEATKLNNPVTIHLVFKK